MYALRTVLIVVGLAFCGQVAGVAGQDTFLVGVAKTDITPATPVRMYGYAARKAESTGIAGRLQAAALALGGDEGEGPAVLLSVDCGAVPNPLREEVLRRVQAQVPLRPERFMLCNSHNHSGPDLQGMEGITGAEHDRLAAYAGELTEKLTRVVLDALQARQPGRLAVGTGGVGFAANRRVLKDGRWVGFGAVPDAPVDHRLLLLRATDAEGQLLAVVVNYACHNTTLRGDFPQIHGDWAGEAQQAIERAHPGAAALVTIGCGADADPCPHGTVELCRQHGQALADEVTRLLAGPLAPLPALSGARLEVLEIPFLPLPPREELRQAAANSYPVRGLLARIERGEQPPRARNYTIGVWTFGRDLAMVFLSDEVVVDYALRLQRELDGHRLWINAYAHDVSGYIVSPRLIAEGGYETNNSVSALVTYGHPERLAPSMEDQIVSRVRALLPEFAAP